MLINSYPDNERNRLKPQIIDPLARETILVDFRPVPDSKIGELSTMFDGDV